jgi:hypothetical protein
MVNRWNRRSTLSLIVALTFVSAIGAASPDERESPLDRDSRLDVKLSLAEKDRPLGDIVAGLGREINVPLRASRDIADDRATLFLDDRPAVEVLGLVARQFDFQWYRRGNGYELGQTIASRNREAALRAQALGEEWAAVRTEMERRPAMADTPRARLVDREQEIVQRLQDEDLDDSELQRLSEERTLVVDALHPGRAPAQAIFRALNPDQIQQLLAGRDLWLSSADGTLPRRIAEMV